MRRTRHHRRPSGRRACDPYPRTHATCAHHAGPIMLGPIMPGPCPVHASAPASSLHAARPQSLGPSLDPGLHDPSLTTPALYCLQPARSPSSRPPYQPSPSQSSSSSASRRCAGASGRRSLPSLLLVRPLHRRTTRDRWAPDRATRQNKYRRHENQNVLLHVESPRRRTPPIQPRTRQEVAGRRSYAQKAHHDHNNGRDDRLAILIWINASHGASDTMLP
jgi:hypothetical protein